MFCFSSQAHDSSLFRIFGLLPWQGISLLTPFSLEMETIENLQGTEVGAPSHVQNPGQEKLAVVLKSSTNRHRHLLLNSACLLFILGILGAISSSYMGVLMTIRKVNPLDYEQRVKEILSTTPLIDGHNDLPYLLRIELQNKIYDSSEFQFWNGMSEFEFLVLGDLLT